MTEAKLSDVLYEREKFEEVVFRERFLRSIKPNQSKPANAIAGCLDFTSQGCPNKDEFVARDEGGVYKDESVSAMWFGWCLAISTLVLAEGATP